MSVGKTLRVKGTDVINFGIWCVLYDGKQVGDSHDGNSVSFPEESYYYIPNDRYDWIYVSPGFKATVYKDSSYKSTVITFSSGKHHLGYDLKNKISSIKVYKS